MQVFLVNLLLYNSLLVVFFLFSGPWFIGEVIDGHRGACFAFGVFIDGHYLEGSLTYVVGVIQVRKSTTSVSANISVDAFCVHTANLGCNYTFQKVTWLLLHESAVNDECMENCYYNQLCRVL